MKSNYSTCDSGQIDKDNFDRNIKAAQHDFVQVYFEDDQEPRVNHLPIVNQNGAKLYILI